MMPPLARNLTDLETRSDATPAPTRSFASRVVREVRSVRDALEPRRLAWTALGPLLPDFALAGARARLLRMVGCDVRRGAAILGHAHLVGGGRDAARNLRIGPGCIVGPGVVFCLDAPIVLGANVSIGPRAMLYTATHALGPGSRRMSPEVMARPIFIGSGAWIGVGALLLPGVKIGVGSVVGAGAVVNEDVAPHTLVAGNPARVVEELPLRDR